MYPTGAQVPALQGRHSLLHSGISTGAEVPAMFVSRTEKLKSNWSEVMQFHVHSWLFWYRTTSSLSTVWMVYQRSSMRYSLRSIQILWWGPWKLPMLARVWKSSWPKNISLASHLKSNWWVCEFSDDFTFFWIKEQLACVIRCILYISILICIILILNLYPFSLSLTNLSLL